MMIAKKLLAAAMLVAAIFAGQPLAAQDSTAPETPTATPLSYFAPLEGVWKSTSDEDGEARVNYTQFRLREELNAVDMVQLSADPETKALKSVIRAFIGIPSQTNQIQAIYFFSNGFVAHGVGVPTDAGVMLKATGVDRGGRRFAATVAYEFGDGKALTVRMSDMIGPEGHWDEGTEVTHAKTDYERVWNVVRDGAIAVDWENLPPQPGILSVLRPLTGQWQDVEDTSHHMRWYFGVMDRWVFEHWNVPDGTGVNISGVDPESGQLALWSVNANSIGRSGYWEVLEDGVLSQRQGRARLVRELKTTDAGERQIHGRWQQLQGGRFVDTDRQFVLTLQSRDEASQTTSAPLPDGVYAVFDYMKVPRGEEETYVELEKSIWRKIHQQRLKEGAINAWMLLKVVDDEDKSRDYSYITVSGYSSPEAMQKQDFNGAIERALSAEELEGLSQRTDEARQLIRSDVWRVEGAVVGEERPENPFLFLDFMKPAEGRSAEYAAAEREVFRTQHQTLIDAGVMSAWYFNSLQSSGADRPYEFVTVNVFPRRDENAPGPSYDEVASKWRAGLSAEQSAVARSMMNLRKVVRHEVVEIIDAVLPEQK